MIPRTIREMEPHIKQRFRFATESFARIFGVGKATSEMIDFCYDWALQDATAPLDCLNNVDCYFRELWNSQKR